jgi:hypothetical protein
MIATLGQRRVHDGPLDAAPVLCVLLAHDHDVDRDPE